MLLTPFASDADDEKTKAFAYTKRNMAMFQNQFA